jgi:RNA polymerase sigma factor (sigma-70 family)
VEVPPTDRERARAAEQVLSRHSALLRRTARRVSICADDADDALQRATEIMLTKAPSCDPNRLIAWMRVVTRNEALAVRRARERGLGYGGPDRAGDRLDSLVGDHPDPAELAERGEWIAEARAALAKLKPAERLAILLQAQGYSYGEICALCGWTYTKVNRSLAEGRAKLRRPLPASARSGDLRDR